MTRHDYVIIRHKVTGQYLKNISIGWIHRERFFEWTSDKNQAQKYLSSAIADSNLSSENPNFIELQLFVWLKF